MAGVGRIIQMDDLSSECPSEDLSPLDIAVISLHTSPLAQPGVDDSGGMNVYVKELAYASAHLGHNNTIYVRCNSADADASQVVEVEPGVRLVMIPAGDPNLTKEQLQAVLPEFVDKVLQDIASRGGWI